VTDGVNEATIAVRAPRRNRGSDGRNHSVTRPPISDVAGGGTRDEACGEPDHRPSRRAMLGDVVRALHGRRSGATRRTGGASLVLGALLITGCPAPGPAAGDGDSRGTATDAPGPAPLTAAPRGGTGAGPDLAVDLAADRARSEAALHVAGTSDGGALVLMGRPPAGPATRLVRVSPDGRRAGSLAVPAVSSVYGLHVLADGTALVSGLLDADAIGVVAVDPAAGAARTARVVPLDAATHGTAGRSALSADGRTVWLVTSTAVDGVLGYLLTGVDAATGELRASRDLFAELRGIHHPSQPLDLVALAALPGGGVALLVNTFPPGAAGLWSPTLLVYDDRLEPSAGPVALVPSGAVGTATALAAAADGTVLALVRGPTTGTVLALPPTERQPRPLVEVPAPAAGRHLLVDAAGRAVLGVRVGAWTVDLGTGTTAETDVGCPGDVAVRGLAADGGRTWLIGGCFEEGSPPTVLWSLP
jgi:hypothetical protein